MPTQKKQNEKPPEIIRGTLDMMILKTLSFNPNHGYAVARRIQQVSDDLLTVEEGSLYPALHRLEKRGHLLSTWKQTESNRRAKYYRLTAQGKKFLTSEAATWDRLSAAIGKVMNARTSATADAAPSTA